MSLLRRRGISPTLALMAGLALLPLAGLFDTAAGSEGGSGGEGGTGSGGAGAEGGAAGGSSGGSGAGSGSAGGTGGTGGTGAQKGSQGSGEPQDVKSLPQWAQTVIADARKEAATNRVGRTAAETARADALKALAATLGVDVTKGDAPTVESVTGQLTTVTAERDQALAAARLGRVQLAALPVAAKHGADPVALMDSASFLAKLGQLDPAGDKFAGELDAAVKAAVEANPRLKAGQAPGRGGFDPNAGSGGDKPAASLEEAFTRRMAPKS